MNRTVSPEAVIETALERNAGAAPSITTNAIMQALKSNGLRIVKDSTKTITYCMVHKNTKMPCQMPHPSIEQLSDTDHSAD